MATLAAGIDKQSLKAAHLALARWQREGHAVDAKDQAHVEAYLLARKESQRPRVDAILETIGSQRNMHEKGCRITSQFYIVSESQFVCGIPPSVAACRVNLQELLDRYDCGDTDFTGMALFHKNADVKLLPPWTHEVSFYKKSSTLKRHKVGPRSSLSRRLRQGRRATVVLQRPATSIRWSKARMPAQRLRQAWPRHGRGRQMTPCPWRRRGGVSCSGTTPTTVEATRRTPCPRMRN